MGGVGWEAMPAPLLRNCAAEKGWADRLRLAQPDLSFEESEDGL